MFFFLFYRTPAKVVSVFKNFSSQDLEAYLFDYFPGLPLWCCETKTAGQLTRTSSYFVLCDHDKINTFRLTIYQ